MIFRTFSVCLISASTSSRSRHSGFSSRALSSVSSSSNEARYRSHRVQGVGRYYLFPLAAAGQAGVERALELMRAEIERDMRLMGCTSVNQLGRANLRFR